MRMIETAQSLMVSWPGCESLEALQGEMCWFEAEIKRAQLNKNNTNLQSTFDQCPIPTATDCCLKEWTNHWISQGAYKRHV